MLYLVRFITERHTATFRIAEFEALLALHGGVATYDAKDLGDGVDCPYLVVETQDDVALKKVVEDGVLVRDLMEIWGRGPTHEACMASVGFADRKESEEELTWSCAVEVYGHSLSYAEQEQLRVLYARVAHFPGKVRLKNPELSMRIVERHSAPFVQSERTERLEEAFYGRIIAVTKRRPLVVTADLKKRCFLGPTALDNELGLIMASVAHCKKNALVLDPFVGTGSILVACALYGSMCFGTDIDWRVLKGKGLEDDDGAMRRRAGLPRKQAAPAPEVLTQRKTLFSNFDQYKLPYPEVVRMDSSRFFEHWRAPSEFYDAIVTDPPYGLRAGARCTGAKAGDAVRKVPEHLRDVHVPMTTPYAVADVIADLLGIAARSLKVGGRLAYLLPATVDFQPEDDVPSHPALELVCACPQPISTKYSRWLVVMRKTRSLTAADTSAVTRALVRSSADAPWEKLKEKLMEPARASR